MTQPIIDWSLYRRCRICQAVNGQPCVSHSRRIVAGQPDGVRCELEHPHLARRLRTRV